jgi:hypothetical protein
VVQLLRCLQELGPDKGKKKFKGKKRKLKKEKERGFLGFALGR